MTAADLSYRDVNRDGWRHLARRGSDSSQPYLGEKLTRARSWLDPHSWLQWEQINTVLCLGAGGGQQGPMFASLGCAVTVVDLCAEQLEIDSEAASSAGLDIECIEADMQDLRVLAGRRFDLVHQPVSTCYVPNVRVVYAQVRGLLDAGGWYDVEHWNPVHTQLVGYGAWDGGGYVIEHPQVRNRPLPWYLVGESGEASDVSCWHYAHHLEDLIGGVCHAGFHVVRVVERPERRPDHTPGTPEHLAAFAPSFLRVLSRATATEAAMPG